MPHCVGIAKCPALTCTLNLQQEYEVPEEELFDKAGLHVPTAVSLSICIYIHPQCEHLMSTILCLSGGEIKLGRILWHMLFHT